MKPENKFARELVEALDAANIKWRDYSGRGMFGEYCVGVSCGYTHSAGDVRDAVKGVGRAMTNEHSDQLGKGSILYWPAAKLVEEDHTHTHDLDDAGRCRSCGEYVRE